MQKFLQKYGKNFNEIIEIEEIRKLTKMLGFTQLNFLILRNWVVIVLVFIDFRKFLGFRNFMNFRILVLSRKI